MKTYKFKINGNEYNVDINSVEGNMADVTVNGTSYKVEMDAPAPAPLQSPAPAAATGQVPPQQQAAQGNEAAGKPSQGPARADNAGTAITSPLPGVIIEVSVKEGQEVKAGQKVAVIEAMKMENEIQAPKAGTVTAILVSKGDSVPEGAEIAKIA